MSPGEQGVDFAGPFERQGFQGVEHGGRFVILLRRQLAA